MDNDDWKAPFHAPLMDSDLGVSRYGSDLAAYYAYVVS
jgi:hypothetical protein